MRFRIFLSLLISSSFLIGCNHRILNREIDDFILKFNDTKFNEIEDISVSLRSQSPFEAIYIVGKRNLPVYFVTYNLGRRVVTTIDKSNLQNEGVKDYLTKQEINSAIVTIRKYQFFILSTDSLGNVYINPFRANEPVYFLRVNQFTGDTVLRKGFVYKHYKDRWYINESVKIEE